MAAAGAPAVAAPASPHRLTSAVTSVQTTITPVAVGGEAWQRIDGVVSGVVDPREEVDGLASLPKDAQGLYHYSAPFQLVTRADATQGGVVLVEATNRGLPILLAKLQPQAAPSAPSGMTSDLGHGVLSETNLSYAWVQWQTGITQDVPQAAQGVGEVIVRDFGRLLEGATPRPANASSLRIFDSSILAGISQASWFVNTFVAEGFNVDVTSRGNRGVYDAALPILGAGNWLPINKLAGGHPQRPYALPDGVPLTYGQLLTRTSSDPLFVDVAAYTDYYRLRASVTAEDRLRPGVARYDWPAPHGHGIPEEIVFGQLGCNGGTVVPLNPIDFDPYLRTLVTQLAGAVEHPGKGGRNQLPPSAVFTLQPAPLSSPNTFNNLPGVPLSIPDVDPDTLQPLGGVRHPDAVVPVGRPTPVSLAPVRFTTINDVCGNFGGWQPFTAEELASRYTNVDGYVDRYATALDAQIREGYLTQGERARMLASARAAYLAAPPA